MSPDPAVNTIGRYEVLRLLGQGASGARYLARDPVLDLLAIVQLLAVDDAEPREATWKWVLCSGAVSREGADSFARTPQSP